MKAEFESQLLDFKSELWGSYIPVQTKIAQAFLKNNAKRVVCTINGQHSYQCAIMPKGDEQYFLLINKATIKKFNLFLGQKIKILIEKDESKYGLPVPEEFQVLLEEDGDFASHFEALTPGKQRNIIYAVGKPKSSELRLRTAVVIANHLAANNGKLDFKMLNEALKNK